MVTSEWKMAKYTTAWHGRVHGKCVTRPWSAALRFLWCLGVCWAACHPSGVRHYDWCHPGRQLTVSSIFFPKKNWRPFFSHHRLHRLSAVSFAVSPLFIFHWKTDGPFVPHHWHFYSFHLGACTFFTCPTSFVHFLKKINHNFFSFRCHPLENITRGGPLLPQWRHWCHRYVACRWCEASLTTFPTDTCSALLCCCRLEVCGWETETCTATEIPDGYIAYFSLRMRDMAIFLLPV